MFDNVWLGHQSCIKLPVSEACIPISGEDNLFQCVWGMVSGKGDGRFLLLALHFPFKTSGNTVMPYFQCQHACFWLSHFIQHILSQQGWWCSVLATPVLVTLITVVTQSVWQMADGGISNYKRSVWCGYSAGPFSIAGWGPVAGDGDIFTRSQGCPVSRLQTPESTHLTTTTKIATTHSTTRRLWAHLGCQHQLRRKCCKIMFVQFYLFWIDAKPSLTPDHLRWCHSVGWRELRTCLCQLQLKISTISAQA